LRQRRTKKPKRAKNAVTLDTVRQLALSLPGVKEETSGGMPAFRVRGKILARFYKDGDTLALKTEYATREVLIGTHPEAFYVTDNYRCWPWMFVRLSTVELGLLRGLLEDAWRPLASKRQTAAHEADGNQRRTT